MTRRTLIAVLTASASVSVSAQAFVAPRQLSFSGEDLLGHESVRGYAAVSQAQSAEVCVFDAASVPHLCVVPIGKRLTPTLCEQLVQACSLGCTVLLEHPVAFGAEANRELLQARFGLQVHPSAKQQPHPLYVQFRWPRQCFIRSFGPLHTVIGGQPIAFSFSSGCAGVVKQQGKGRLICLSVAIGPQLLSGDPQARAWFEALTRESQQFA